MEVKKFPSNLKELRSFLGLSDLKCKRGKEVPRTQKKQSCPSPAIACSSAEAWKERGRAHVASQMSAARLWAYF